MQMNNFRIEMKTYDANKNFKKSNECYRIQMKI